MISLKNLIILTLFNLSVNKFNLIKIQKMHFNICGLFQLPPIIGSRKSQIAPSRKIHKKIVAIRCLIPYNV